MILLHPHLMPFTAKHAESAEFSQLNQDADFRGYAQKKKNGRFVAYN